MKDAFAQEREDLERIRNRMQRWLMPQIAYSTKGNAGIRILANIDEALTLLRGLDAE